MVCMCLHPDMIYPDGIFPSSSGNGNLANIAFVTQNVYSITFYQTEIVL